MTLRARFPFAPEDLALAGWSALAVPLLGSGDAAALIKLGDQPDVAAGVVQLLAVIAVVAAVASRPSGPRTPAIRGGAYLQTAFIGPFIGAVAFVGGSASAYLGLGIDGLLVALAFVAIVAATAFADHLPTVDATLRRALLLPFVLVCAGIFEGFAADLLEDLDIGALVTAATVDETGFGLFVLGLLLAGIGAFYAALIVAPRVLVERPSAVGWMAWPLRFMLFLASAVLGIGWLTVV